MKDMKQLKRGDLLFPLNVFPLLAHKFLMVVIKSNHE